MHAHTQPRTTLDTIGTRWNRYWRCFFSSPQPPPFPPPPPCPSYYIWGSWRVSELSFLRAWHQCSCALMPLRARHTALWPRRMIMAQAKHAGKMYWTEALADDLVLCLTSPEADHLREAKAPAGSPCPLSTVRLCFMQTEHRGSHHSSALVRVKAAVLACKRPEVGLPWWFSG